MPVDFTALNKAVADAVAQVDVTKGVDASAEKLITSFGAAVTKAVADALTQDAAANQTSIDAATAAIAQTTSAFAASSAALGAAVASNPTPAA